MGKIFYLMGKSSSGKDTLYKKILEDERVSLKTIVPYTTRPIREGEEEGVEYHFVTKEQLEDIQASGNVIELRTYETCHGLWHYFTVDDGQIDLSKEDYLIIGTLESYEKTRDYFGQKNVIAIMIELDDGLRLHRAIEREHKQEHPKYEELCRRFLADSRDFSKDNLEKAKIRQIFYNHDLEQCKDAIVLYMKSHGGE